MRIRTAVLVLALCVVAACGGGDDSLWGAPESTTTTAPAGTSETTLPPTSTSAPVTSTLPPMSTLPPVSPDGPACDPAPGGRIAYQHQSTDAAGIPVWSIRVVGADGTDLGTVLQATDGDYPFVKQPAWSPDGTRLAVLLNSLDAGSTIAILHCDGTVELAMPYLLIRTPSPVNLWIASPQFPNWSADGSRIAFVSSDGLFVVDPANSGLPFRLGLEGTPVPGRANWSPDGASLIVALDLGGRLDIYLVPIDGRAPVRLTDDPAADYQPALSPDGSSIAFRRGEEGGRIWLMAADGSNQRPLTREGTEAYQPAWSPDGTEIVYVAGDPSITRLRVIGIDGAGDRPLTPEGAVGEAEGWPSWTG